MDRVLHFVQRVLGRACLGLGAAAIVIGCQHACKTDSCGTGHCGSHSICHNLNPDNCSDVPQGAIPRPIGTFTNELLQRQYIKAEADDFVVYYNEFVDGQAVLGPFGSEHIDRIIARLASVPFPVVVQPEPDHPILSALRRQTIVDMLAKAGVPDASGRVFLGRPAAEGLFGDEAVTIYPRLAQGGGGFAGGGAGLGGGFAGFSGAGFGGGGGFGGFNGFR